MSSRKVPATSTIVIRITKTCGLKPFWQTTSWTGASHPIFIWTRNQSLFMPITRISHRLISTRRISRSAYRQTLPWRKITCTGYRPAGNERSTRFPQSRCLTWIIRFRSWASNCEWHRKQKAASYFMRYRSETKPAVQLFASGVRWTLKPEISADVPGQMPLPD